MGNSMNKVTILNVSGKKKDREELKNLLKNRRKSYGFIKTGICKYFTNKDFSKNSSNSIIRKVLGIQEDYIWNNDINNDILFYNLLIFENLSNEVIKDIGDELDNIILDIHLNKYNKKVASQQIQEIVEFLEKI